MPRLPGRLQDARGTTSAETVWASTPGREFAPTVAEGTNDHDDRGNRIRSLTPRLSPSRATSAALAVPRIGDQHAAAGPACSVVHNAGDHAGCQHDDSRHES